MKQLIRRIGSGVLFTVGVMALLFGGGIGEGVGVLAFIGGLAAYT